jgi:SAM-dependent methyltransferase
MTHSDSYEMLAKHYDSAYAAKPDLVDSDFYVDLAKRSGGPVLEIGCGTGRILRRIAAEGIEIHGVDNSPAMLSVLKKHLENDPRSVRDQVKIHLGDMRSFRLNKTFPLVIMPFRPIQHMYTVRDQVDALTTAAAHLQGDGRLAFDVFYPKFELLAEGFGKEKLELEWTPGDKSKVVRRFFRKDAFDKIHQNFSGVFIVRTFEHDKLVLEEAEPLKMAYYTYPHLQALFLLAGLETVEEYGSFAKAPLDNNSAEMIFVLKKANRSHA